MTILQRIIYTVIAACSAMIVFNPISYADIVVRSEDKVFDCNKASDSDKPSEYTYSGRLDTSLSLTTKGIQVDGWEKLFTKSGVEIAMDPELKTTREERKIYRQLNVKIRARCSGSTEWIDMWPVGTTLNCKPGDGIIVEVFEPKCDCCSNQHVVFTLKEERDEEVTNAMWAKDYLISKIVKEDAAKLQAEKARLEKLRDDKIKENIGIKARIEADKQKLKEQADRVCTKPGAVKNRK